ncbi:MAG: TRAP transporter small permease subunit [Rhizobiales bacterium]|nr:TRAP transporter small permease subunit [Hyphomicrobiales bacterium]
MGLFGRFLRLLTLAAGGVLLLLMAVTVLDVLLRYVFNAPLASAWEFTEFSMALIVFLGIAYCGWTGGHIAVDVFEKWLDRPSLRFLPALIAFVGAALFALIAYRATLETVATIDQVSNMLRWPHYPFRFTVAFGSAMLAVVLAIQGAQSLRRRPAGDAR